MSSQKHQTDGQCVLLLRRALIYKMILLALMIFMYFFRLVGSWQISRTFLFPESKSLVRRRGRAQWPKSAITFSISKLSFKMLFVLFKLHWNKTLQKILVKPPCAWLLLFVSANWSMYKLNQSSLNNKNGPAPNSAIQLALRWFVLEHVQKQFLHI